MASACLNNSVTLTPPENFIDCSTFPSYGWLSPRVSFSREFSDGGGESSKLNDVSANKPPSLSTTENVTDLLQFTDLDVSGKKDVVVGDFEFMLEEDPVTMLPADELFLDGKLMPLHVSTVRAVESLKPAADLSSLGSSSRIRSPETAKCRRKPDINGTDVAYLFSPKAPRCSSKWKEMLGLKKLYHNSNNNNNSKQASSALSSSSSSSSSSVSGSSNSSSNVKSLKHLLHRSSRSSSCSSASDAACMNLPLLLKDSDSESVSISSRLSLSSSSSGHEHEDLPRLSLDSEKPNINSLFQHKGASDLNTTNPPRLRLVKPRPGPGPVQSGPCPLIDHPSATMVDRNTMRRAPAESCTVTHNGVTADSPRMNPSGKIVFQSLERSSSSPSTFNGSQHKVKPIRGMERSYSANVRVTPVLNVPVCSSLRGSSKSGSVFGFGQLFSTPQKRENGSSSHGGSSSHNRNHQQQMNNANCRNRTDRN